MARRKVNPTAIRATIEAAGPGAARERSALQKLWPVLVANVLTVLLLSLSFPPYDGRYLAWFALVPWLVMLPASREAHRALWQWAREPWQARKAAPSAAQALPRLLGVRSFGDGLFYAGLGRKVVAGLLRLLASPGILFWAANLYWLWWITLEGYVALVGYLSLYWLTAALLLRWAMRRNMPLWLMLPLVWVSLEWARSYIISGFPWFYLGHTQYQQTALIQIADISGQYGVSFVVAMVNGLLADGIGVMARWWARGEGVSPLRLAGVSPAEIPLSNDAKRQALPTPRGVKWAVVGAVACAIAIGGLLTYGYWRLGEQTTATGPVIGIVQQAYPIALGRESDPQDKILKRHVESSQSFIGQECDLVLWPESMLPSYINAESLDLDVQKLAAKDLRGLAYRLTHDNRVWDPAFLTEADLRTWLEFKSEFGNRRQYARDVAKLTQQLRCPLLAGGPAMHRNGEPLNDNDRWLTMNGAMWFDNSDHDLMEYDKVHLVPFSEYVPFRHEWPWLHQTLRAFVPDVMTQLEPGSEFRTFRLTRGGKSWGVAAPICFEGTFDRVCRKMVVQDGKKVADILANLSNDGWFVWKWFDGRGSTEQSQHLAQYCFRAVENRVPVVRAVNTGISASVDSCGRIQAAIEQNGQREMVAGTLLLKNRAQTPPEVQVGPQVLVDSRLTLYSLYGDVVPLSICLAAIGVLAGMALRRPKAAQEETT